MPSLDEEAIDAEDWYPDADGDGWGDEAASPGMSCEPPDQHVQNLEVVRVDSERNLLLVKGAVPGARGGDVIVTPAVKA